MTTVWDAAVLARVRHLHLRARQLTDGWMSGAHRSRRVGQAIEFADYQQYQPGMDLRGLDWRVWGRTDRYVVKRYECETEVPCVVVLDLSADLCTGTAAAGGRPDLEKSKAGYAITLAATLLFALQSQGEPVGLELIGSDSKVKSFPPRTSKNHLQRLFVELATVTPMGQANLATALARVGARVRRRGFVALISDAMEEPESWLPALAAFAKRRSDLRLVHIFDPDELSLSFERSSIFYSPEDGSELAVDPLGAKEAFIQVKNEYIDQVRTGVIRWGARYINTPTSTPMLQVLSSLLLDVKR